MDGFSHYFEWFWGRHGAVSTITPKNSIASLRKYWDSQSFSVTATPLTVSLGNGRAWRRPPIRSRAKPQQNEEIVAFSGDEPSRTVRRRRFEEPREVMIEAAIRISSHLAPMHRGRRSQSHPKTTYQAPFVVLCPLLRGPGFFPPGDENLHRSSHVSQASINFSAMGYSTNDDDLLIFFDRVHDSVFPSLDSIETWKTLHG